MRSASLMQSTCLALIAWILSVHTALGAELKSSSRYRQELYDAKQWTVTKSVSAHFGTTLPKATVLLLRSVPVTGRDGVDRPLHSANLVVIANREIVYAFAPLTVGAPDSTSPIFDIDDLNPQHAFLELEDVTGDGLPEIIFHSGWRAASDWENVVHVLQFVGSGPTRFRDIRREDFTDSWWHGVRFLKQDTRALAVVAEPVDPPVAPDDFVAHGQPRFHRYSVYRWDQKNQRFELQQRIPESRTLHDSAGEGLDGDWRHISAAVHERG
jgi:hypothetical protein